MSKHKEPKKLPTAADIDDIIKDLQKARKDSGIGEDSYSTDGRIEKVTISGYTIWQPHGTRDKHMKEYLKKLEENDTNNN